MSSAGHFYRFLLPHVFLVGLLPALLPNYLWMLGYRMFELSMFIVVTAIGFVIALWWLDRLFRKVEFSRILISSFLGQALLIGLLSTLETNPLLFYPIAVVNGFANCFFWINQRTLFFEMVNPNNTGKRFGNFQILVAVILNVGIIVGAYLIDAVNIFVVFGVTLALALVMSWFYYTSKNIPLLPKEFTQQKPLTFKQIYTFRDRYGSAKTFWLDGFFLYLESYYWLITLFLISNEDFLALGILVVSLAIILGLIFIVAKNTIDRANAQLIYIAGVTLYALSWLLRVNAGDGSLKMLDLYVLLILITFANALFRLAYNKRFFDIAKVSSQNQYLIIKSYWSQTFAAVSFTISALFLHYGDITLEASYYVAALGAFTYLYYRPIESINET